MVQFQWRMLTLTKDKVCVILACFKLTLFGLNFGKKSNLKKNWKGEENWKNKSRVGSYFIGFMPYFQKGFSNYAIAWIKWVG